MPQTFFISDTHFGHRFVSKLRGFESPEEHDQALISAWNKVVSSEDEVYLLGDVSFRGTGYTLEQFAQLKGTIRIVPGNHDKKLTVLERAVAGRGEILPPIHRIKVPGQDLKVSLCHFPMASWDGSDRGSVQLHGHLHGSKSHHFCAPYKGKGTRINVDVESIVESTGKMSPLKFDTVLAKLPRT